MLTKLIKYEWKATWKACAIINFFTVFSTALGTFALYSAQNGVLHQDRFYFIVILIYMFYYITLLGVSFSMSIYIGVRFYRNLYTEEGYLMHTLPVTKRQLVISKLLVHTVCMIITGVLLVLSILMLLLPLFSVLYGDPSPSIPWAAITATVQQCEEILGISLPSLLLCGAAAGIIGQASGTLTIYCAIALGQSFRRHRVMGSILCYIGIYCLIQTLTTVIMSPQMFIYAPHAQSPAAIDMHIMPYMYNLMLSVSVESLFIGIACYLLTLFMMNRKLNLD